MSWIAEKEERKRDEDAAFEGYYEYKKEQSKLIKEPTKELETIKDGSLISVDNVYQLTKSFEEQVEVLKAEEKKISQDRKKLELYLENAKQFIKKYMVENGLAELDGTVIRYSISRGNPSLVISDEKLVPADYKESTVTETIRKDAIKDQLKMGDVIPGCELKESITLKVGLK